jgi:hypothetical protein
MADKNDSWKHGKTNLYTLESLKSSTAYLVGKLIDTLLKTYSYTYKYTNVQKSIVLFCEEIGRQKKDSLKNVNLIVNK